MLSIVHLCRFCLRIHRLFTLMAPLAIWGWIMTAPTSQLRSCYPVAHCMHCPGTDTVCMLFVEELGPHACNSALLHARYSLWQLDSVSRTEPGFLVMLAWLHNLIASLKFQLYKIRNRLCVWCKTASILQSPWIRSLLKAKLERVMQVSKMSNLKKQANISHNDLSPHGLRTTSVDLGLRVNWPERRIQRWTI